MKPEGKMSTGLCNMEVWLYAMEEKEGQTTEQRVVARHAIQLSIVVV